MSDNYSKVSRKIMKMENKFKKQSNKSEYHPQKFRIRMKIPKTVCKLQDSHVQEK